MGETKKTLCDATTGRPVEVISGQNGRLFHVEGFNRDFISTARKAVHVHCHKGHIVESTANHADVNSKSSVAKPKEV